MNGVYPGCTRLRPHANGHAPRISILHSPSPTSGEGHQHRERVTIALLVGVEAVSQRRSRDAQGLKGTVAECGVLEQ